MAKQWKQSLTAADVQAEAEDALEKDIANLTPATNSVAGQLNGGITSGRANGENLQYSEQRSEGSEKIISASGSGIILGLRLWFQDPTSSSYTISLDIDGVTTLSGIGDEWGVKEPETWVERNIRFSFDSSFTLTIKGSNATSKAMGGVFYALD